MLADCIAKTLEMMLNEQGGILEFRRNELATEFMCAPSQITYVIASRFTPERGYIIESQRGGGGYIRITKKEISRDKYLMHFFYAIGDSIGEADAIAFLNNLYGNDFLTERETKLAAASMSGAALSALPLSLQKEVRAQIFKQILLSLM